MEALTETLKLGVGPGIVLAIYLIINKIIDNKKESSQAKVNNQLTAVMTNINNFIISVTKNVIDNDKNKCEIAVRDALDAASLHIIEFVIRTLINNHIDTNKDNIVSNLRNIVQTEYYNIYRTTSLYTINNTNVSSILKPKWIQEIENIVVTIMYNNKLDNNTKILTITNRIHSLFNTYATYINNNGIK